MFGLTHILYIVISGALSAALLVLFGLYLKDEKQKVLVLKVFSLATVAIHFSSLWIDFFREGSATVQDSMLFPIYPCNVCMWLLLITAFVKHREGIAYRVLCEFTFWAGTVCGIIGIVFNENFGSNPTLADYDILKGLLSHSTMVIGAIYLLIGGFIKVRVKNVISVALGLCLFVVDGFIINTLFSIFGIEPCNSMYLLEAPFPAVPWLNTLVIGIMAVTVCFICTATYEQFALEGEDRWYAVLKRKIHNIKENKKTC